LAVTALLLLGGVLLLLPRPESPQTVRADATIPTLDDGVLTVGAAPTSPYSFSGPEGPTGFDVDIVLEVARRLGLEPQLVPTEEGDPFSSLVEGHADVVVAGAPITVELEGRVNLSEPYVQVLQALVVNADARPDLTGLDDLAEGDDVAVVEGSTGHAWATSALEPEAMEVLPYPDVEDAAVALAAGAVDALIVDEVEAMTAMEDRESLRVLETVPTGAGLGIGVDPRNGALLTAVNRALADMAEDGTYDRIYDRYRVALPPGGRITGR
jgi:polar amino acid transport system substrate-binding protein